MDQTVMDRADMELAGMDIIPEDIGGIEPAQRIGGIGGGKQRASEYHLT
jgi:hypothetical protein